jgi:hypothetical protein
VTIVLDSWEAINLEIPPDSAIGAVAWSLVHSPVEE